MKQKRGEGEGGGGRGWVLGTDLVHTESRPDRSSVSVIGGLCANEGKFPATCRGGKLLQSNDLGFQRVDRLLVETFR